MLCAASHERLLPQQLTASACLQSASCRRRAETLRRRVTPVPGIIRSKAKPCFPTPHQSTPTSQITHQVLTAPLPCKAPRSVQSASPQGAGDPVAPAGG